MTDTAKTAHDTNAAAPAAHAGLTYVVEMKCSSGRYAPQFSKWGRPTRIWVRGYDETGKKIFQESVGFCDSRCTGPRSHAGQLLERAHARAKELAQAH